MLANRGNNSPADALVDDRELEFGASFDAATSVIGWLSASIAGKAGLRYSGTRDVGFRTPAK
jgi:hypothetical protein